MIQTRLRRMLAPAALLVTLTLVAAACGSGASASSGDAKDLWVKIASPSNGAKVTEPFTVKLQSGVPIGEPSTGDHHVHLCFDGASCDSQYQLAYTTTVDVKGLTPGMHTIEASLRNADHSDAGPSATITITVGGAGGTTSGGTSTSTGGAGGYGY
jgi:hypothetical protein